MVVFILSVAVLGGCAMFGRSLLSICGVNNLSIMGGSLILGYGIFGLALLLSLKYLDSPLIGALIFAGLLGAMTTRRFNSSRTIDGKTEPLASELAHIDILTQPNSHDFVQKIMEGLIAAVLVSWVVAIALTFVPMSWLTVEPEYRFPEIFDLPKHFFAMLSLYEAKDWPPPNPFFSNEIFAYNFLFYFPPAFIAKLVGNPLAIFETFLFAVMVIAIALPMTVLDIVRSINRIIICLAVMVMVGLIGLLFGGYPGAGIKSGLWVRIALVPLAGVGLLMLASKITHKRIKVVGILAVAALFVGIAIVNYPTTRYFVQSAWHPIDPGLKNFVCYIHSLPMRSRIALFSTEQELVAFSGRQIDFDFSPLRTDSYMPPEGRLRAKHFWGGFTQNDYKIWAELEQRYDYLIAPTGSSPDARLATRFPVRKVVGRYSVYKIGAGLES
ncbi:hypothetical protein QZJ86_07740 [Methylomonas montana]|uniref:hypothetical protein n=1 Tax=Methylomonas montana TaxID=3058963 RepID=UPI002657C646|nr:hypothetical protein [Methylomonas montana]WKJ92024.1 hypothetical protein QZJ86_07740 [Methylomonas montana]